MRAPRVGTVHTFHAVGMDVFDRRDNTPEDGAQVRVCQPFGCPKNGTMGHCYVEDMNGRFIGLVCIDSLQKRATR